MTEETCELRPPPIRFRITSHCFFPGVFVGRALADIRSIRRIDAYSPENINRVGKAECTLSRDRRLNVGREFSKLISPMPIWSFVHFPKIDTGFAEYPDCRALDPRFFDVFLTPQFLPIRQRKNSRSSSTGQEHRIPASE